MKKTKKLLVALLTLLLILCLVMPTFSWYNHNGSQESEKFGLDKTYPVSGYSSDFEMVTYRGEVGSNGRIIYDTTQGNEISDLSTSVEAGESAYFRTDIANKGTTTSRIGLYLNNICDDAIDENFLIGTTSPIYTKRYFVPVASADITSTETMRIYFQHRGKWSAGTYYVYCYRNTGSRDEVQLTKASGTDSSGNATYYADIPTDTKGVFFTRVKNEHCGGYDRTQTMEDIASDGMSPLCSVCYYIDSSMTQNDYGNAMANCYAMDNGETRGSHILNYYSTIYGDKTGTTSIALEKEVDYTGNTIEYSTSDENVATVDADGNVTISAGATVGDTCTITTTVKGKFLDKYEVKTPVEVIESTKTLPVAENIKIASSETIQICWFIKNDTDTAITFDAKGLVISL